MFKRNVRVIAAAIAALGLADAAAGQSSLQVPVQFDFRNPGARSLALGGAFVGLADDATASLVNPAGLIKLTRTEVSVEGYYSRLDQSFLVGGRLSGAPTGRGTDTLPSPEFQTLTGSGAGASYVSVVYPINKARVSAYRHELADLNQHFTSRGVFQNHGFETRDTAFTGSRTLSITTYGGSAAYDLKGVWLGAGVMVQRFRLGFDFVRYLHEDFYGAPDRSQQIFQFTQDGRHVGVGMVVGAVVPVTSRRLRAADAKIGVAYKRSPSFGFSSFSGGLAGSQQHFENTFKVPDTFAVGGSVLLGPNVLLTAEYTRVLHSQLLNDYVTLLASQGESRERLDRFSIADGNEPHIGAEYILPVTGHPAIRVGAWHDPDHSVHFAPTPAYDLLDERIAVALSSGKSLWHGTVGTMVSVRSRMDLSVGVDHSARSTTVSASVILHLF